jgi:hypothetical protein
MQFIIMAAIGLLVMVIIFAITTGRLGIFSQSLNECKGRCLEPCTTTGEVTGVAKCSDVAQATCDSAFETPVTGQYIQAGQPRDLDPDSIIRCSKCCVRVG